MNKTMAVLAVSSLLLGCCLNAIVLIGFPNGSFYGPLALGLVLCHAVPVALVFPMLYRMIQSMRDETPPKQEDEAPPEQEEEAPLEQEEETPPKQEDVLSPSPVVSQFADTVFQGTQEHKQQLLDKQAEAIRQMADARPYADAWLRDDFRAALKYSVAMGWAYLPLNPTYGLVPGDFRNSLSRLLFMGKDEGGFLKEPIHPFRWMVPRGQCVLQTLFADGFTLTLGSVTYTSWEDVRPALLRAPSNTTMELRWPHIQRLEAP